MAATSAMVGALRRMVNEPQPTTYTDAMLRSAIEAYPALDSEGRAHTHSEWEAVYDLNAAASDVWAEKANVVAGDYDFSADGGNYQRSQVYEQCMKQSRYYAARRVPGVTKLIRAEATVEPDSDWPNVWSPIV